MSQTRLIRCLLQERVRLVGSYIPGLFKECVFVGRPWNWLIAVAIPRGYSTGQFSQTGGTREQTILLLVADHQLLGQEIRIFS